MEKLNDDGQWIITMAFIICIIIFLLALIVNESILVGQTTAEGVLEFSKSDIQDLRNEILRIEEIYYQDGVYDASLDKTIDGIEDLSMQRKNSIVLIKPSINNNLLITQFHFNNGVTRYNETMYSI